MPEEKNLRLNGTQPVQYNIAPRTGQFDWHNAECAMQLHSEDSQRRLWWCATHGQWAEELPHKITVEYADGSRWTAIQGEKFKREKKGCTMRMFALIDGDHECELTLQQTLGQTNFTDEEANKIIGLAKNEVLTLKTFLVKRTN